MSYTDEEVQFVIAAIETSLKEWGFDPSRNKIHRNFRKHVLDEVVSFVKQRRPNPLKKRLQELKVNDLPSDPVQAIQHVPAHDIRSWKQYTEKEDGMDVTLKFQDALDMNCAPPYQLCKNNATGMTYPRLKLSFKGFSQQQLDPLDRFVYQRTPYDSPDESSVNEEVEFRKLWLFGLAFEALVSCRLVHHEACRQCFAKGSMRWNGGVDGETFWAWSDVVCINCGATYEIKSKSSVERINQDLQRGFIPGGSFQAIAQYPAIGNQYMVLVSRQAIMMRDSNVFVYPVYTAEIARAKPNLSPQCFPLYLEHKPINIKTDVHIKSKTNKLWFAIPVLSINLEEIARDVYISVRGHPIEPEATVNETGTHQVIPEKELSDEPRSRNLNTLRQQFQQASIDDVPDDWETRSCD